MHNLATATLEQRLILTPLLLANVDGDFEMLCALAVPREYPLVVHVRRPAERQRHPVLTAQAVLLLLNINSRSSRFRLGAAAFCQ